MITKIREYLEFKIYINTLNREKLKNSNSTNISVFSNPRGGSTWLAKTLHKIPQSAIVWEPLFKYNSTNINRYNPFAYPEREALLIAWNQFVPDNASWPELETFFDKLFNKEIVNLKLYRYNQLKNLKSVNIFIFKFCFGNNMLPWLAENYAINPVLLIRHPCAVVASQLHYGAWDWHKKNYRYEYNMLKYASFYEPYCDVLDSIACVEERLAAEWAMTVLTPIKHPKNDINWVSIAYEHMLVDPDAALTKIFDRFDLNKPADILKDVRNETFSKSSFPKKNFDGQLDFWKNTLSAKQIERILSFIERMGVDFYSENPEPNYSKIYVNEENRDYIFTPDTILRSLI